MAPLVWVFKCILLAIQQHGPGRFFPLLAVQGYLESLRDEPLQDVLHGLSPVTVGIGNPSIRPARPIHVSNTCARRTLLDAPFYFQFSWYTTMLFAWNQLGQFQGFGLPGSSQVFQDNTGFPRALSINCVGPKRKNIENTKPIPKHYVCTY